MPSLNVCPNFFDQQSHSFSSIGLTPQGTLFVWPSVCRWNIILNDNFLPTFWNKCFYKPAVNLAFLSLTINLGIPWCFAHISKKFFVESKVAIVFVGAIFANLNNQLTTIRMVSILFHSSNVLWNPWRLSPMVHLGLIEVFIIHIFFINELRALTLYTCVHKMFYILFDLRPIELVSYGHPCGSFPTMHHHGHIMFVLHDICAKIFCWHTNLKLFPS